MNTETLELDFKGCLQRQLNVKVATFVKKHDELDSLIIVYYNDHSI